MKKITNEYFNELLEYHTFALKDIYSEQDINDIDHAILINYKVGTENKSLMSILSGGIPQKHTSRVKLFKELGAQFAKKFSDAENPVIFLVTDVRPQATEILYSLTEVELRQSETLTVKDGLIIKGITRDGRKNFAVSFFSRDDDGSIALNDFNLVKAGKSAGYGTDGMIEDALVNFYKGFNSGKELIENQDKKIH